MPVNARTFEDKLNQHAVMERALLDGRSVADVVASAVQVFKVSRMSAYRDVVQIRNRWKSDARRDLATQFGKALARRERLYRRAVVHADEAERDGRGKDVLAALTLAHRIEKDKCELLGLYPAGRVLVVQRDATPRATVVLTDDELRQIAAEKGDGFVLKLTGRPAPVNPPCSA